VSAAAGAARPSPRPTLAAALRSVCWGGRRPPEARTAPVAVRPSPPVAGEAAAAADKDAIGAAAATCGRAAALRDRAETLEASIDALCDAVLSGDGGARGAPPPAATAVAAVEAAEAAAPAADGGGGGVGSPDRGRRRASAPRDVLRLQEQVQALRQTLAAMARF